MGITYSDMMRVKNSGMWASSTNFMTGSDLSDSMVPLPIVGKNNANAKFCSRPMPGDGQNPNISTGWGCAFKLDEVTDVMYLIVANQKTLQIADAAIRGYAIEIDGTNGRIDIEKLTGGGGLTNLATYAWTPDTNLHWVYFSREVSGANRYFRLYMGDNYKDMLANMVAGPSASDTSYTNFMWWGWDHLTHGRCMCGGEFCVS